MLWRGYVVDKPIEIIDNFKLDKPACELITKERLAGKLDNVNWLMSRQYDATTKHCVQYAQHILRTSSDNEVKNTWIEIETICANWRKTHNGQIKEGQKYLPIKPVVRYGTTTIYQPAKDADLFLYLYDSQCPETDESTRLAINSIVNRVGLKSILAIMILYENHIGRHNDVLGTYSTLLNFEAMEKEPDVQRGIKIAEAAKKGHEQVYGTAEEKSEKWNEYQEFIDKLYQQKPSLSYSDLKRRAATHFDVSCKTIDRHTTNPKKKS